MKESVGDEMAQKALFVKQKVSRHDFLQSAKGSLA